MRHVQGWLGIIAKHLTVLPAGAGEVMLTVADIVRDPLPGLSLTSTRQPLPDHQPDEMGDRQLPAQAPRLTREPEQPLKS